MQLRNPYNYDLSKLRYIDLEFDMDEDDSSLVDKFNEAMSGLPVAAWEFGMNADNLLMNIGVLRIYLKPEENPSNN